jgi:hypothetical protein
MLRSAIRLALVTTLLPACAASVLAGATTVTGAAMGTSALQRKAGGCIAMCTGALSCNPRTGLCETPHCSGPCAADEHCEFSTAESRCAPGAPGDVATRAPGSQTVPVMQPWVPVSSGPPEIVPAAEQHPPSSK